MMGHDRRLMVDVFMFLRTGENILFQENTGIFAGPLEEAKGPIVEHGGKVGGARDR